MARPVEDAVLEQSPLAKLDLRHVLEKNIRQHHFLGGSCTAARRTLRNELIVAAWKFTGAAGLESNDREREPSPQYSVGKSRELSTRLPKCVAKSVKAVVEMETVTRRILAAARFLSVLSMPIYA